MPIVNYQKKISTHWKKGHTTEYAHTTEYNVDLFVAKRAIMPALNYQKKIGWKGGELCQWVGMQKLFKGIPSTALLSMFLLYSRDIISLSLLNRHDHSLRES